MRHADHRSVLHGRVRGQRGLDLGGVDVDAARDDHVDLAIGQEEVTLSVNMAHVARGEEAIRPVGLRCFVGVVVVTQLELAAVAQINRAGLARVGHAAVVAHDHHLGRADAAAHRARAH